MSAREDRFHHDAVAPRIPRARDNVLHNQDACLRPKKHSLELCEYTRNDCESIVTHADVSLALRATGVVAPVIVIITANIIIIDTKIEKKDAPASDRTYDRTTTTNGKSICKMRKEWGKKNEAHRCMSHAPCATWAKFGAEHAVSTLERGRYGRKSSGTEHYE